MRRRDDKSIGTDARRETAPGAGDQAMLVGTVDKVTDLFAPLLLATRGRLKRAFRQKGARPFRKFDLGFAQIVHLSKQKCVQSNLGGELQCLKTLEGLREGLASNHHAMVFEHNTT